MLFSCTYFLKMRKKWSEIYNFFLTCDPSEKCPLSSFFNDGLYLQVLSIKNLIDGRIWLVKRPEVCGILVKYLEIFHHGLYSGVKAGKRAWMGTLRKSSVYWKDQPRGVRTTTTFRISVLIPSQAVQTLPGKLFLSGGVGEAHTCRSVEALPLGAGANKEINLFTFP